MARVATAYVEVRPDLSNFGTYLKMGLASINPVKEVKIEPDMSGLAEVSARLAAATRDRKVKIKPEVDKSAFGRITKAFRTFGDEARVGIIGRIFGSTFKAMASVMESTAATGGAAFEKLGKSMMDMGGVMGPLGESFTKLGAGVAGNAASMGNLVGLIVGFTAAAAFSVIIVGALSTALAAVLAIVIPLIAAVTALVAEFVALGAAISASLLLIPGAVAVGAAAFGPLIAVMDKFQAMFEKTAKAVGPLYEVMERLRNAIFAVISNDFVKTFETFATTVLPKVFVGIDQVAQAWNNLLLGLFKLASVPGFIDNVNQVLAVGASLVNLMAEAAAQLGPALLDFAVAAMPAIKAILADVMGLVRFFGEWFSQMTQGQGAVNLFSQVANFAHEVLILFRQIAPLAGTFMSAAIGPATTFIHIIGQIIGRLSAMFSTVGGMLTLQKFFSSMNLIVAELGRLFIDMLPSIMEFGSIIADAMVAARPLTEAFLGIMMTLLRTALPGVIGFMKVMAKALTDPGVVKAVEGLGLSIGQLFSVLGDTNSVLAFIQALSLIVDVAEGLIWIINKLAAGASALMIAYKVASGNISGAVADMSAAVSHKADEVGAHTQALGTTWKNLSSTASGAFGDMSSRVTAFANANAWQVIIDNANAASDAIAAMGRNAFDASQLQDEKKIGKAFKTLKAADARAKKAKPVDLSAEWTKGWNQSVDTGLAKSNTGKQVSKYLSNLKPTLPALNVMDLIKTPRAYDTGLEIARYLAKGITSGAKNIAKATSIIYKTNKANLAALANSVKSFAAKAKTYLGALPTAWAKDLKKMTTVSQLNTYLETQHKKWTTMLNDIVEFKKNVVDALTPHKNLTGVFGYFPTPGEVKARLDQMYNQMKQFTDGLANLQANGLDPQLAREWLQSGIEGAGNMVQSLQGSSAEQLLQINQSFSRIGTEADKIAESQAIQWKGVGESTVRGYISGIESMQALVTKTMTAMLKAALAAAKKSLKIKSPSQVFADIGVDTMLGYIEGINSMASTTLGTVSDMYGAVAGVTPASLTTPTVKPPVVAPGTLGAISATPVPDVNVRVYIGDRELTDMVRVVLDNADSTRARSLLAGRRGG